MVALRLGEESAPRLGPRSYAQDRRVATQHDIATIAAGVNTRAWSGALVAPVVHAMGNQYAIYIH